MSRICVSGTYSCAALSIAGYKAKDLEMEKEWQKLGGITSPQCEEDVNKFFDNIIVPTTQPLGVTDEWPLSELLLACEQVDCMATKYITTVLNKSQFRRNNYFWPNLLYKHGFRVTDKTFNELGMDCLIMTRNNNRRDLTNKEKEFT
jgi:hypothetical protein